MAIARLRSGHWRGQARREQSYASEAFPRHEHAQRLAIATEPPGRSWRLHADAANVDPTEFEHLSTCT